MAKLPLRQRLAALLSTRGLQLIARLLTDQGSKHWRGYAFSFAMTGLVAATTALSAWIMRSVINDIFVAKKLAAVWFVGCTIIVIYMVKGFATYGQMVVLARIANGIVADVQKRIFKK